MSYVLPAGVSGFASALLAHCETELHAQHDPRSFPVSFQLPKSFAVLCTIENTDHQWSFLHEVHDVESQSTPDNRTKVPLVITWRDPLLSKELIKERKIKIFFQFWPKWEMRRKSAQNQRIKFLFRAKQCTVEIWNTSSDSRGTNNTIITRKLLTVYIKMSSTQSFLTSKLLIMEWRGRSSIYKVYRNISAIYAPQKQSSIQQMHLII